MGLLDDFSNFAKTPEGQGLLSAAFGGLAGARRGAPLNSIGNAGLAGLQGYAGALDRNMQVDQAAQMKQYREAQMGDLQAQAEQRRAAAAKAANLQEMISGLMKDSAPQTGQLGSGTFDILPTQGGAPQIPSGSWLTRLPLEKVTALKMVGGPDLTKEWELGQTGVEMKPGSSYTLNGQTKFGPPKVADNMQVMPDGNGGYKMGAVPGAAAAVGELTGAAEAAKGAYDFIDVPMGDGRTVKMSRAQAADVLGQPTSKFPPGNIPSVGNMQPSSSAMDAIRADIAKNGNPSPVINFKKPTIQGAELGVTQSPLAAGEQRNIIDAGGKINDTWLKTSYTPTIEAGQAAQSVIDNTQIARDAMRKMGSTGWGTDTKAAAAGVLSGLGIASKNADMYASNAQVFQKAASERLWSVLNNAKGPQTEGDASRASKTYGQLSNTTQANEFILDLAQANAEREKAKAAFFSNALPIAKSKGDLSEVEREWAARMPSIFNMPSMKRWNK